MQTARGVQVGSFLLDLFLSLSFLSLSLSLSRSSYSFLRFPFPPSSLADANPMVDGLRLRMQMQRHMQMHNRRSATTGVLKGDHPPVSPPHHPVLGSVGCSPTPFCDHMVRGKGKVSPVQCNKFLRGWWGVLCCKSEAAARVVRRPFPARYNSLRERSLAPESRGCARKRENKRRSLHKESCLSARTDAQHCRIFQDEKDTVPSPRTPHAYAHAHAHAHTHEAQCSPVSAFGV